MPNPRFLFLLLSNSHWSQKKFPSDLCSVKVITCTYGCRHLLQACISSGESGPLFAWKIVPSLGVRSTHGIAATVFERIHNVWPVLTLIPRSHIFFCLRYLFCMGCQKWAQTLAFGGFHLIHCCCIRAPSAFFAAFQMTRSRRQYPLVLSQVALQRFKPSWPDNFWRGPTCMGVFKSFLGSMLQDLQQHFCALWSVD